MARVATDIKGVPAPMIKFRSNAHAAGYLGGIIDGEGHVTRPDVGRAVRITNTDPAIVEAVISAAVQLGLVYTVNERDNQRRSRKPSWEVGFYGRANLERLAMLVPLSPTKRERLDTILSTYLPRPPTEVRLRDLYEGQGLSLRAVAARVGLSKSGLQFLFAKYGISCRPVGQRSPAYAKE